MSTNLTRHEQTIASLQDKAYRDAIVAEQIETVLPFQIRAMRDDRGWTQKELGSRAEMKQETISLLESLSYGSYTLRTLKRLASAFDVALIVRFAPFSELANWATNLSPENLAVPSFDNDPGFREPVVESLASGTAKHLKEVQRAPVDGNVVFLSDHVSRSNEYERTDTVNGYVASSVGTNPAEHLVGARNHG